MKERPILFSGEMVRAVLEGRKTQTRRVVKMTGEGITRALMQPGGPYFNAALELCPYGKPGQRLWVRECFSCPQLEQWQIEEALDPELDELTLVDLGMMYKADEKGDCYPCDHPWRPSIHMPRWASRITLEVTGVRVERLQEISEDDAISEGMKPIWDNDIGPVSVFAELWDDINKDRGYPWDSNPWVWVVEFKIDRQSDEKPRKIG